MRVPPGYLMFAVLCLIIPAGFITLHIVTPSDGARLSDNDPIFTPVGAVVSPYYPGSSVLQEGDVVFKVAGRTMESWAEDLFRVNANRIELKNGETVTYGVLKDGEPVDVSIVLGQLPVGSILTNHWGAILFAAFSQVVAVFVLIKRPGEPAARALFIWAMSGSHTYAWSFFLQVSDVVGGLGFWLFRVSTPGLWLIYWPAALHLALVFPKPLITARRLKLLIPSIYLVSFGIFLLYLGAAWQKSQNILDWLNAWTPAETVSAALFLFAAIVAMILQYRSSSTWSERARIRLVVAAGLTAGLSGLILWIIIPSITRIQILNPNLLGLLMLLFPLSVAVAIWRYQLFDIDLVIRKTLVYGVITIALGFIYLSSVVLLQFIITLVSGQRSTLAIVMSTLLIAASFNPLRSRVQKFIDKQFFRGKYNAQQAVESFGITARDETDLKILENSLVQVVQSSMQPESITLWLSKQAG